MKGRIPGFSYNPKKHLAHFSLYVPKTNGKLRRERTVHASSREEAIRLWQTFRDEIAGQPPAPQPPSQPSVMTFASFVTEYDAYVVTSEHFNQPRKFGFGRILTAMPRGSASSVSAASSRSSCRDRDRAEKDGSAQPRMGTGGSRWRVHSTVHEEDEEMGISALCKAAISECRARRVLSRHVFVNDDGTRVAEIALRRAFLRAKRIAGITRRLRFHDLRHTAACTLASAGVSLQVIQKILGHTSSKMTERYVRVNDAALEAARNALNAHNHQLEVHARRVN